jgi:urease accessory protein
VKLRNDNRGVELGGVGPGGVHRPHRRMEDAEGIEGLAMKYEMGARRLLVAALCVGIALLPNAAAAHTGVHYFGHGDSFVSGFLHPILGLDHLVAMVAIGFWAAYAGGSALVVVPVVFVGMMIVGAALGANGFHLPAADQTIAVSLVVFGLMICMLVKLPAGVAAVIVGLFATFHGYAHGTEIPDLARALPYGAGFVLATVLLLGLGIAIGSAGRRSIPNLAIRGVGAAVMIFGIVTVIG